MVKGYVAAFEQSGCDELILIPSSSELEQVALLAEAAMIGLAGPEVKSSMHVLSGLAAGMALTARLLLIVSGSPRSSWTVERARRGCAVRRERYLD